MDNFRETIDPNKENILKFSIDIEPGSYKEQLKYLIYLMMKKLRAV